MMDICKGLMIYEEQEVKLQQFRTDVVNGHEYYCLSLYYIILN